MRTNKILCIRRNFCSMSLKEKFESHPVVWGLGLLVVGSVSGYGFNETITAKKASEKPKTEVSQPKEIACKIEGLEKLSDAHNQRVSTLLKQLVNHESGASDSSLIPSYRQEHKDSAERIRKDIAQENALHKEVVEGLRKKCS
ncbi:hypothetical protein H8F06_11555 [Vibrio fluvialis]|uniref:hypothetical protein n=1 Tax=Vibrio fluvialis TaxID=676 RepID=UPI00192AA7F0|nr:hypothetical protein [Vibrio fluvialis]MBL4295946.1 hypothetical protein [Vibrio fluvialis]